MACSAASIVETANWHRWDITIVVGECAWLSTEHFKIPPPLSHKISAHFIDLYPVLHAIGPVSF